MRMWGNSKSGIALPLVLLLTAVLGFTMLTVITSLVGLRRETAQAKRGADFQRAAMTAEARFQFLAITEPVGSDGLYVAGIREQGGGRFPGYAIPQLGTDGMVLAMDGRPYRWSEEAGPEYRVAIQDEAGLVNIYQADVAMLTRLFLDAGLDDTDAANLANELIAYNADPALHQPMRRPSEIYRLESASTLLTPAVWRKLSELIVSYSDSSAVNINTAPAQMLKIWFDLSDQQAEDIIRQRQPSTDTPGSTVITSPEQLGVAAPAGAQTYAFPGGRLRFKFTDPATGDTYQSSLVLTPNHVERPVWIENARTRHLKPQPDPDDELQDFPEIPDLAS